MTPIERRLRAAQREQVIRAELARRRPRVVLVPQRLARVGLGLATGAALCLLLVLAGCDAGGAGPTVEAIVLLLVLVGLAVAVETIGEEA